jgi:hypothetical protein
MSTPTTTHLPAATAQNTEHSSHTGSSPRAVRSWAALMATVCVLGAWPSVAASESTLYNGIVLPDVWPPRDRDPASRAPMPVPYLTNRPDIVPIDVGRQLFVDDFLIEKTDLRRTYHHAQKFVGNPILKAETPKERDGGKRPGVALHSGGVWYDHRDRWFKMWYMPGWYGGTAFARSRDGLAWERPILDLVPGTNLIPDPDPSPELIRGTNHVRIDWFATDEAQRFRGLQFYRNGLMARVHTSMDGIRWSPGTPTGPLDDKNTFFYNPFRKRWVFSIKASHAALKFRARSYFEHKDFVNGVRWGKQDPVFWVRADDLDQPAPETGDVPELYDLECVPYESLIVGLFQIHKGPDNKICAEGKFPKLTELMLGFSRDGFHWHRPDRRAFIGPTKQRGDWERTYIEVPGGGFLVVGDYLYFYYSAYSGEAPTGPDLYAGAATGVAFLRRAGFASMDANASGGTLTTRPVRFGGSHLFVNADVPDGELRAEVLDVDGKVVAPFSLKNSVPLTANTTRQSLRWQGADDLRKIAGQVVRLRFHLKNGQLFSFWVSPDKAGHSQGYVAAGGPEFKGPVDSNTGF